MALEQLHTSVWDDHVITRVSSSSGSSGVVQAVWTLPLHSVVLISNGEFPLDDVTESFWRKPPARAWEWERHRETETTVTEMILTTPLMPFLPTRALGTTTKYVSMPLSFRYSQRSPPFPGSTSNSPCRHSRVFWEMCTRLPDTHECVTGKHNQLLHSLHNTCRQCCCFTVQNYRTNSLTGFRIHSWTFFDSLKCIFRCNLIITSIVYWNMVKVSCWMYWQAFMIN